MGVPTARCRGVVQQKADNCTDVSSVNLFRSRESSCDPGTGLALGTFPRHGAFLSCFDRFRVIAGGGCGVVVRRVGGRQPHGLGSEPFVRTWRVRTEAEASRGPGAGRSPLTSGRPGPRFRSAASSLAKSRRFVGKSSSGCYRPKLASRRTLAICKSLLVSAVACKRQSDVALSARGPASPRLVRRRCGFAGRCGGLKFERLKSMRLESGRLKS